MKYRVFKSNPRLAGITRDSLKFFRRRKSEFGNVVKALVYDYDDKSRRYPLILINDKGDRMYIGGCCAGYYGEGSRGTATILFESGLLPEGCNTEREILDVVASSFELMISKDGSVSTPPKRRGNKIRRKAKKHV